MSIHGSQRIMIALLVAVFTMGAPCAYAEDKTKKNGSKKMETSFKQKVMDTIPYSEDIKYMWDVVDGDVDLHFAGLRGDRRNQGLKYTTDTLPFVGQVDGMELQFKAGSDNGLFFKSDKMPLIGRVKGLSYKGALSNSDSAFFARYTIALD